MRTSLKPTLVTIAIIELLNVSAFAQTAKPAATALETIVIEAQRTPNSIARLAQEESPNLINVMTVEEMRKLPDVSIAESVRRIPGIAMEADTGEGRFINIRGLDSDLNSVTFGGLRLPPSNTASPFGGGRAVALDAIPTGLVGAITVTKTNLPEQDAEALGGTIEITPKTTPRNGQPFFDARIGTGIEPARNTPITDISISMGMRFGGSGTPAGHIPSFSDKPFSVVFTAAYYEDQRGFDDVEQAFVGGANPYLSYDSIEQRHYQYNRKRHGYGIDLGYEPDGTSNYYIRAFEAGYEETVLRNRLTIQTTDSPVANGGSFTDSVDSFDKTLRDARERISNKVLALGGKNTFGDMVLDYRLGYTSGSDTFLNDYNSTFRFSPASATVTYNNSGDGNTPRFTVSGADYVNPSNYTLKKFSNKTTDTLDKENSLAVNLKSAVKWGGFDEESFKTGFNARMRNRTAGVQPYSYSLSGAPSISLANASGGGNVNFYNGAYNNGPQITPGVLQGILAPYQMISSGNASDALLGSQTDKENVSAVYGQYQFEQGKLTVIGGLRVESTHAEYGAYAQGANASGNSFTSPITATTDYTNAFPSVQAKYELSKDTFVRTAFSSTIARPGFNQINPSVSVDPGGPTVSAGNPNLKPTYANSFDISWEKYLPSAGIVSIGFFDKELSNYIANNISYATFPNSGLYAGLGGGLTQVVSYTNISNSYARGLELNYEQKLKEWAAAADGWGIGANYTFVNSKFEIRPGESSLLPSTSQRTANATVYYENNGLNLRIGAYYVSRNLFGIGGDASSDVFCEPRFSVDFGGSYALNKQVSVYFNAKNMTNTPLVYSQGTADRVIQREFYGATYLTGVNLSF